MARVRNVRIRLNYARDGLLEVDVIEEEPSKGYGHAAKRGVREGDRRKEGGGGGDVDVVVAPEVGGVEVLGV